MSTQVLISSRSRFFSTMHGVANAHGISHKDLCWRLAMPFENNITSTTPAKHIDIMSDPLPVSNERRVAMRKLDDLAFNAKLREARQALDAHRPDMVAQRKASEGLRSMRSSQIPSSPPTRAASATPGFNERMAAIPTLSNPFPEQCKMTPDPNHSQPPPSAQRPRSQQSQSNTQLLTTQSSTQISEAAAQLHSDLTAHVLPVPKQEWEWNDQTRGYVPKIVPTLDQNMWRTPTEIYNSAIAYNVKVQEGKKKEKLFVYENPLMSEQLERKRSLNSAKALRRARRKEGRGFEGPGKRKEKKKAKKDRKAIKTRSSRQKRFNNDLKGADSETSKRMQELQARLAAKLLGQK